MFRGPSNEGSALSISGWRLTVLERQPLGPELDG